MSAAEDLRGQTHLIVGLARQGIALAHYLARYGVHLRVTDARTEEMLRPTLAQLAHLTIEYTLGSHPESLLDGVDVVYVSGGVPLEIPLIAEAKRRGIHLSNDSQLFLNLAPCPVIGITGSSGKTTTTSLVGEMGKASPRQTWVGGNIGYPLLNDVDQMQPDDLAVMELSSFQLDLMTSGPAVAGVLNVTPNHLDRHKTMAAYTNAKANIVRHQQAGDIAVLGWDDPVARSLAGETPARVWGFGLSAPDTQRDGAWLEGDALVLRRGGQQQIVAHTGDIRLRGQHNLLNTLAAIALAGAADVPIEAMNRAICNFKGVDHRLEVVRIWRGITWINDSIATSPERAMAAIRAFDEPLVLMLGGYDKALPWDALARLAHEQTHQVILFGAAAELIEAAFEAAAPEVARQVKVIRCGLFAEAVERASQIARAGDVVLMSPGCASFDEFDNFAVRGDVFRTLVNQLGDGGKAPE